MWLLNVMVRKQTLILEEVGGPRAAAAARHNLSLDANTQELKSESAAPVLCPSEVKLRHKQVG